MKHLFAFLILIISVAARAQEIPLDSCRQLPIVKVTVGHHQFQFLLDTGAGITVLNQKSFSSPESTEIMMDSWQGAAVTSAREVVLRDFTVGEQSLANLKLLAIDLASLERSCLKRVDGVLGADLIARLGLTIDLKNHVASLEGNSKTPEARINQLEQHQMACEQAFNRSDEKMFEDCLDPNVVLLTSKGDYHGRKAVMKHFKESYFGQDPPVLISITPRGWHAVGGVIWTEYDMSVTVGSQVMKTRGTALYQKTGERWLMSNMNYAVAEPPKVAAGDR
ncbi:MAG TPA: aspartyl protease family protein [Verrucomicrobiae bacterium]|jgi:hypothetical protein|nr:aspartyl protease family protein [Verrucomicrobiae bacterium]